MEVSPSSAIVGFSHSPHTVAGYRGQQRARRAAVDREAAADELRTRDGRERPMDEPAVRPGGVSAANLRQATFFDVHAAHVSVAEGPLDGSVRADQCRFPRSIHRPVGHSDQIHVADSGDMVSDSERAGNQKVGHPT